jgi:phospholipase C
MPRKSNPGRVPGPAIPPPTASPIEHVVIIVKENHTFDN